MDRFEGNFGFASRRQCGGQRTSRRDDVQSAFFILLYLLGDKKLPWLEGANATLMKEDSLEWLAMRSRESFSKELTEMVPNQLKRCFVAAMRLSFKDEPRYQDILDALENCFVKAVQESNSNLNLVAQSASSSVQIKEYTFEWNVVKGAALSGNLSIFALSRGAVSNAGQQIALLNRKAHNVVSLRSSSVNSFLQQFSLQNSGSV